MNEVHSYRWVAYIALFGLLIIIIWGVLVPSIKYFQKDTLAKRIMIETSSNKAPFQVSIGTTTLTVNLAETTDELEQGLGGRFSLPDDEGMLFVFDRPGYPQMWMKDMLFSLDMAWLDSSFKIVHIEKNVSPETFKNNQTFSSSVPSQYVLEVNAGFFDEHNIREGQMLDLVDNHPL